MLDETLRTMARSGLNDHLAGGFYRYTVDGDWTIPHFEKMLYDNAQLISLYAGKPGGQAVVQAIREWLASEMQAPEGGYYAALDADSEGEEGKYYVWQPEEVEQIIGAEAYPQFAEAFGLDQAANFESEAWHLKTIW